MMTKDTRTRAQRNKAIRQDALREQLESQGHVQHVLEMVDKIRDVGTAMESEHLARYKLAIETKLKLITKYLPDLKSTEIDMRAEIVSPEQWLEIMADADKPESTGPEDTVSGQLH